MDALAALGAVRIADGGSVDRAAAEAGRLGRAITARLAEDLESTMTSCFADAQSLVPVDTRSLKASGRTGGEVRDFGSTWVGWMAWGGPSAPKDVDYAVYLAALGGEHDWLRNVPAYEAALESVIERHLGR